VDSVTSTPAVTASAGSASAVPDAGISEVGELIVAEHARILRLFRALDDLARRGDAGVARLGLAQVWARLASLLEVHTQAEEEICFPLVFASGACTLACMGTATADHDDIREAIAEARLLDVGSARWWRLIATIHAACTEHFASEERGPLMQFCGSLPPATSKALVRQWAGFAAGRTGNTA
jgi:hemerythrin HHE cation binding domain-containing protein